MHIHGPYSQGLHGNKLSIIVFQHEDRIKFFRAVEQPQQNLLIVQIEGGHDHSPYLLSAYNSELGMYTIATSISEIVCAIFSRT